MEFRRGEGTSFSAPQVSAAAALLFASDPGLQSDQVATLLTRSAADANSDTGCSRCPAGRDALTGWGVLDVASSVHALDKSYPDPDRFEANDRPRIAPWLWGRKSGRIRASIDYWDDRIDLYQIKLRRGGRLVARLRGPRGADTNLFLWKPGTRRVEGLAANRRLLAARSTSPGSVERIRARVRNAGWYYLEVKMSTPGSGGYVLSFRKRPRPGPGATAPR